MRIAEDYCFQYSEGELKILATVPLDFQYSCSFFFFCCSSVINNLEHKNFFMKNASQRFV